MAIETTDPGSMRAYVLTDDQAFWIADLLRMASDPTSGVIDTTSGGGYSGDQAKRLFDFLDVTMRSIESQRKGGFAIPRVSGV